MSVSELRDISTAPRPKKPTRRYLRMSMAIAVAVLVGGMLTYAYAQSTAGSAFNLNSPASFPVDI